MPLPRARPRPAARPRAGAAPPGRRSAAPQALGPASVEWTRHKTADGQHPDGNEQAMLWLMNRARQNPPAEGVLLATSNEPDVAGGRTFFQVDLGVLQSEFAGIAPKPPAVFDNRLHEAARLHSLDLIARDAQSPEFAFRLRTLFP